MFYRVVQHVEEKDTVDFFYKTFIWNIKQEFTFDDRAQIVQTMDFQLYGV